MSNRPGHEHQRQEARDDEVLDRVDAEDLQRVELLADLAGAEVGGDRRAGHAGEDDRVHGRRELADRREHEEAAEAVDARRTGRGSSRPATRARRSRRRRSRPAAGTSRASGRRGTAATNSPPYGNGGRSAETIVLPVRIIMSPTSSRRFFTGRYARSAAARTMDQLDVLSPKQRIPEAYGTMPSAANTEPSPGRESAWYRRATVRRIGHIAVGAASVAAFGMAGCGGGQRQDANEPSGHFPVEITAASFPPAQRLSKDVTMRITVRNAGSKTIPAVAVTVNKTGSRHRGRGVRLDQSAERARVDLAPELDRRQGSGRRRHRLLEHLDGRRAPARQVEDLRAGSSARSRPGPTA